MHKNAQGSGLVMFAVVGGVIAVAVFLITFITTQKAAGPNQRNTLKIPVPSVPELPSATPRLIHSLLASPTPIPTSVPIEASQSPTLQPASTSAVLPTP